MKRLPVPPIPATIVQRVDQSIREGRSQDEVISQMRELGLSIGFSIKLASQLYGTSLTDAKIAVHYSETWADMREANEALHEVAIQAAKEAGFEVVEVEEPALRTA